MNTDIYLYMREIPDCYDIDTRKQKEEFEKRRGGRREREIEKE